jgi:hypothetical protein
MASSFAARAASTKNHYSKKQLKNKGKRKCFHCIARQQSAPPPPPAGPVDHTLGALFAPCLNNNLATVKRLVNNNAPPGFVNQREEASGIFALYVAAQNGSLRVAKWLVKEGKANVDLQTNDGGTALYITAEHGHTEVAKCLVEGKANVDLQTDNGCTPLSMAAQNGHADVVQCLVENKANVDLAVSPAHDGRSKRARRGGPTTSRRCPPRRCARQGSLPRTLKARLCCRTKSS